MGRFHAGGTSLGLCSLVPEKCAGRGGGQELRGRRSREGPQRLPAGGLFLASEVFGPRHWFSLPGWFVLKSLLLLIRQKVGQAGQVLTQPLSLVGKRWVTYQKHRSSAGPAPCPWAPPGPPSARFVPGLSTLGRILPAGSLPTALCVGSPVGPAAGGGPRRCRGRRVPSV